jgi:hypothetical protein
MVDVYELLLKQQEVVRWRVQLTKHKPAGGNMMKLPTDDVILEIK